MSTENGGTSRRPRARRHWADPPPPTASLPTLRWFPGWLPSGAPSPQTDVPAGKRVVPLRDGSKVLIRPVRSADAELLAEGFERLSARSRRMRFLTIKKQLSRTELRYLTDIDHHDHEALGALSLGDGRGVGVIRYIRDAHDPDAAEIALTIVDEWQGRGLGTELLARLTSRARAEGVRRFTALVAEDNAAMISLLRRAGARRVHDGYGTLSFEITLEPPEDIASSWPFSSADQLLGPGTRGLPGGRQAAGQRGYGPANVA
jgi:RimJ/RimL family protein N-acetyltransferase